MRQEIDIELLKQNPNNPRFISESKLEKLVQSIKENPELLFIRPIIIDEDMVILGGNMRYKAAKKLGYKKVWVYTTSLDQDKKNQFIIKDNTNQGLWDYEKLYDLFKKEELIDWGFDLPISSDNDTKVLYEHFLLNDDEVEHNNSTRQKNTITFRYPSDITDNVKDKLLQISSTPEQALYTLLKL